MRRLLTVALLLVALVVGYFAVTFVQVWMASRRDGARPAQAIVVLGAAQYNGRPSPVLRARLDHAYDLYRDGLAPTIVVTGGRRPGDVWTEAGASAAYLHDKGVPDGDILRETTGTSSYESLASVARFLGERDIADVLLVSDPFHSARIAAIAEELGLEAAVSPTRTSPIGGAEEVERLVQETFRVGLGRLLGYRRLGRAADLAAAMVSSASATGPHDRASDPVLR